MGVLHERPRPLTQLDTSLDRRRTLSSQPARALTLGAAEGQLTSGGGTRQRRLAGFDNGARRFRTRSSGDDPDDGNIESFGERAKVTGCAGCSAVIADGLQK